MLHPRSRCRAHGAYGFFGHHDLGVRPPAPLNRSHRHIAGFNCGRYLAWVRSLRSTTILILFCNRWAVDAVIKNLLRWRPWPNMRAAYSPTMPADDDHFVGGIPLIPPTSTPFPLFVLLRYCVAISITALPANLTHMLQTMGLWPLSSFQVLETRGGDLRDPSSSAISPASSRAGYCRRNDILVG